MAPSVEVEFYYGLGSRYSYLASTQIERLEADTGCRVRWRPLYSGDLFAVRGANPFEGPLVSGQYDVAYRKFDAECWADYYGVPYREPSDVDFNPARLVLGCHAASLLGAIEAFSRRLFQALFVEGTSPLDDAACARLAAEVGLDRAAFLDGLKETATAKLLDATVDQAIARGVFGVPSFFVANRVYWGNDRLPIVRHVLLKMAGRSG